MKTLCLVGLVALLGVATGETESREGETLGARGGSLWPSGTVPYRISGSLGSRERGWVERAMRRWMEVTCVKFVQRSNQREYMYVKPGSRQCSSHMGPLRGRATETTISPECGYGATLHELGHALGLAHEQSRQDRDRHVRINFNNIQRGMQYNFDKSSKQDVGSYDYGSIMHYDKYAFSVNRRPTIETSRTIGNRKDLSSGDIAAINSLYKCRGSGGSSGGNGGGNGGNGGGNGGNGGGNGGNGGGSNNRWPDGTRCSSRSTCRNCQNRSSYWTSKGYTACGRQPTTGGGGGGGGGSSCMRRGRSCRGSSCNRCCNGKSCPWWRFGGCSCR